MPQRGKSRRVAARQTQLGQRKKRNTPGPSGVPTATQDPLTKELEERASPTLERAAETSRPRSMAFQRAVSGRQAEFRPTLYSYVKPEIRRIVGLSAGIIAILIVLSFVLR